MKVKLFFATCNCEDEINEWLEEQDKLKIECITMIPWVDYRGIGCSLAIAIWYK